ncbi:MAG: bifunctional 2-polyprenyl-6-hydroxyphenol methylase/3-demethylubiquinol 3-O-methyltransferase UbiG [Planctomycetota bacterium]
MSANDLALYDRHAADWWDTESRAFRSLHSVNRFRVARLVAALRARSVSLRGALVLDLGCGGGIVAGLLGAVGARVVGVDRSRASLAAARHGCRPPPPGSLLGAVQGDVAAAPLREGAADLVVLSDVLEHVAEPSRVIAAAARLVRPGGYLYTSTLNRTLRARVLAVEVAERLGLVPRGTHDARLFLRPAEVEAAGRAAGLDLISHYGEGVALAATVRRWRVVARPSRSLAVAYQSLFVRPEGAPS